MPLSWDLMPNDSDGVAYLNTWCLGTVKASLRFAKPLPVTTTLIAYAQYENLVVVDAYHTVTFDYNMWCWASNFRRPSGGSPWRLGCWSMSTPGMKTGPCLPSSRLPTWSKCLVVGLLGNTGWAFSLRTCGMPSTLIPTGPHRWSLCTNGCGAWATGTYGTIWKCYRGHSRGPADSTFPISWSCAAGVCPWEPLPVHSGNTTLPTMRPRHLLGWHTHAYIQGQRPLIVIRPPVYVGETVNAST